MPCTICVLLVGFGVRTWRHDRNVELKKGDLVEGFFFFWEWFWSILLLFMMMVAWQFIRWNCQTYRSYVFLVTGSIPIQWCGAKCKVLYKENYLQWPTTKNRNCSALLSIAHMPRFWFESHPGVSRRGLLAWFTSLAPLLWGGPFDAILKSNPPSVTRNKVVPGLTSWR